jgi:glycosyltransferase involved in cell wall biosynthesis
VILCISRPCLEAELGSRQRVVEAMAHGRPVIATQLGDLAAEISSAGAGVAIPPQDATALAQALLRYASDRDLVMAHAGQARRLWEQRWTYAATTEPLRRWARNPGRWPPSLLDRSGLARLADERQQLQAELDEIRGSYTFRALRLLDRILGRGRKGG